MPSHLVEQLYRGIYRAGIHDSGKIGFRENIDDVAHVKLNNEVIINDSSWNTMAEAQADLRAWLV